MNANYKCYNCEAEFKIKHNLASEFYEVNFCPFCSAEIEDEELEDDE